MCSLRGRPSPELGRVPAPFTLGFSLHDPPETSHGRGPRPDGRGAGGPALAYLEHGFEAECGWVSAADSCPPEIWRGDAGTAVTFSGTAWPRPLLGLQPPAAPEKVLLHPGLTFPGRQPPLRSASNQVHEKEAGLREHKSLRRWLVLLLSKTPKRTHRAPPRQCQRR